MLFQLLCFSCCHALGLGSSDAIYLFLGANTIVRVCAGALCLVRGTWYLVSGIWYLVSGIWYLVPGAWCLALGPGAEYLALT